ncbi:hypothetical protein ACLOJK_025060 [Asimina triloba]
MAEGFLKPSIRTQSMEEMGAQCFHDLVHRSLFQEAKKGHDGSISEFKMHDLIHNLAASVAGIGCSALNNSKATSIHHLTLHSLSCENGALASKVEALRKAHKLQDANIYRDSISSPFSKFSNWKDWMKIRFIELMGSATGREGEGGDNLVVRFPQLEELDLQNMSNLEGWFRQGEEGQETEHLFPSLGTLSISFCPKLQNFPKLARNLKSLSLSSINEMFFRPLVMKDFHKATPCSQNLKSTNCPRLRSLETGNHATLEQLAIRNCGEIALLPGRSQSNTSPYESPELTPSPAALRQLSALKFLYIWNCSKLSSWPEEGMRHLTSLRILTITSCLEFSSLPEALQHFTALGDLDISECSKLEILPESIGYLKSLKMLMDNDCPSIMCLPVAGLQQLTQLQFLKIIKCLQLERRCETGRGEDWHKIAHVPEVQIQGLHQRKGRVIFFDVTGN